MLGLVFNGEKWKFWGKMSATGCQGDKRWKKAGGRRQGAGDKKKEEEVRKSGSQEVRKSKEISFSGAFAYLALLFGIYSTFPCTSTTLPVL